MERLRDSEMAIAKQAETKGHCQKRTEMTKTIEARPSFRMKCEVEGKKGKGVEAYRFRNAPLSCNKKSCVTLSWWNITTCVVFQGPGELFRVA